MDWVYFIFGVLLLTAITYTQEIGPENSIRMRRSVANSKSGEVIPVDPNDKDVIDLVKYALDRYERKVGSKFQLINILGATKQAVAGWMYQLQFYIKPILCKPKHSLNCMEPMNILYCRSLAFTRPWLKIKKVITVECEKRKPLHY